MKGNECRVTQVIVVHGGALVQLSNGDEGFVSVAELLDQVNNGAAQVMQEGLGGE